MAQRITATDFLRDGLIPTPPDPPSPELFNVGAEEYCHAQSPGAPAPQSTLKSNPKVNSASLLRGHWTDFPTWCLFAWPLAGHPHERELTALKHLMCQAHLLLLAAARDNSKLHYQSRLGASFREFRFLVTTARTAEQLPICSARDHNCEGYLTELRALQPGRDPSRNRLIDTLRRLFEAAIEHSGGHPHPRSRSAGKSDFSVAATETSISDLDGSRGTLINGLLPEGAPEIASRLRIAPEEFARGRRFLRTQGFMRPHRGDSLRSAVITRRLQAAQIRRWAQQLPIGWNTLSTEDLYQLQHRLAAACRNVCRNRGERPGIEADELCAFVALGFWLSRTPREICAIRCARDTKHVPKSPAEPWLARDGWLVVLPSYRPAQARRVDRKWERCVERTRQTVEIELPEAAQKHIDPYLTRWENPGRRKLFTGEATQYESLAARVVKYLRRDAGVRLTLRRLCTHIGIALANDCGDLVVACQALGKDATEVRSSGTYYAATTVELLARAYCACADRVSSAMLGTTQQEPTTLKPQGYSGSEVVPTTDFLRGAVASLKADVVRYGVRDIIRHDRLRTVHNAYTSYCLAMLFCLTGARPVRSPLVDVNAFDPATSMLYLSDKVTNAAHGGRLTWAPPVLAEQLMAYRNWRDTLSRLHQISSNEYFYFLYSERRQLCVVDSANLSQQLADRWPVPLNAWRHYFRSELTRTGVPGEIIDAVMGHAFFGREPHSIYSGLNPRLLREHLQGPLENISTKLGWEVLRW